MILTLSGDVLFRVDFSGCDFQRPLTCARTVFCLSCGQFFGEPTLTRRLEFGHELRHCEIIALHLPDLIEMFSLAYRVLQ